MTVTVTYLRRYNHSGHHPGLRVLKSLDADVPMALRMLMSDWRHKVIAHSIGL